MISDRLTKRVVDALPPRDKPYVAYDADLTGFGLRVMPSGVKSWIAEYRPDGGGRGVAKKRVTLGKVGSRQTKRDARRPSSWPACGLGPIPRQRKPTDATRRPLAV